MFDPTKGPGQITQKDCWISATVIGIYLALGKIPGVKINNNNNIYIHNKKIRLKSNPNSYLEGAIRALRVYMGNVLDYNQQYMTLENLEHCGSPDIISKLLVNRKFDKYCCHKICISRLFYDYLPLEDMKKMISSKHKRDVFLCSFSFNPSHLYIVLNIEDDRINIIDVSAPELKINNIKYDQIYILMVLYTDNL